MSVYKILIFTWLYATITEEAEICKKISSCSCSMSEGVIDLSPLAKNDGSPAFKDIEDSKGGYKYSWNPCNDFTEKDNCKNVAGCQAGNIDQSLGDQKSALFINDLSDGLTIQYTAGPRTLYVALKCDRQGKDRLDVKGEDPPRSESYYMTLHSIHACAGAPTGPSGSISVGLIIVIIIFVIIIVYLLGGMAFQKFVRKESGVAIIPNYAFWSSAMGLVQNGCRFVFCFWRKNQKQYSEI